MHRKYDVMNMADDDIVLASVAKLYKSEMLLAVVEVERLKAEVERLTCLFKETERLMLVDGEYEAVKVGTIARLKAEIERLTADLNKMTKTPDGVDGVEVKVSFWNKSGTRLPSSYSTFFWVNDKGGKS